jgi:hypothetical protein
MPQDDPGCLVSTQDAQRLINLQHTCSSNNVNAVVCGAFVAQDTRNVSVAQQAVMPAGIHATHKLQMSQRLINLQHTCSSNKSNALNNAFVAHDTADALAAQQALLPAGIQVSRHIFAVFQAYIPGFQVLLT